MQNTAVTCTDWGRRLSSMVPAAISRVTGKIHRPRNYSGVFFTSTPNHTRDTVLANQSQKKEK